MSAQPRVGDADDGADPTVVSIHISPASRMPLRSVESVRIETAAGITGDRYENARHRQVTIQSQEEIAQAEAELDRAIDPGLTRRNITLSSGLLDRTPSARITIGAVEFEVVRDAAPCKLLEDNLGRDAKLALHKRAGVVCRTLAGGDIALGDVGRIREDEGVNPTAADTRIGKGPSDG